MLSTQELTSFNIKNHINNFIQASLLKTSSKKTYNSKLINFASWLRKENILLPTEHDIVAFHDYLKKDTCLSISSRNGYLTAIKVFFAWLKSKNIYPDIAHTIKGQQKLAGRRKQSLSNQQVKQLLKSIDRNSLDGKRDFSLINFMISTGLRSIEITDIIRGDIANCCGIHVLWVKAKNGNGKDENIILHDTLFKLLINYLEARNSTNDTEPLFASHSKKNFGQPLTTRSIARIIRNRLNSARIDTSKICPASLRYTTIKLKSLGSDNHILKIFPND